MSYPQVVRIFATAQDPDFDCPWQARPPQRGTGSGVIIGKNRILTGAHVIANATFLRVQKISAPDKAVAHVEAVCHDCDLALLRIEDESFTDGVEPAEVGDLPGLRDKVSVVGYPVGGEEISITEGVVSRIEVQRYSHSQRYLLAVTVDAAINSGNSGGPVFKEGKIAGIAFQKLTGADNIGELVPAPLIQTFLDGVASGKEMRVPGFGIATQNLENPLFRRHLGLESEESGVLVIAVEYGGSCHGTIRPGDALLEVDGHRIANNATIQYRGKYRTRYDALLGQRYVGDEIEFLIDREGKRKRVTVTLEPLGHLVPRSQYDTPPTYFVYGGLVFQTLTRDFLTTWEKWWNKSPKEFLHYYYSGSRSAKRQQIVILTQILADQINVGYAHLYNEGVASVNGTQPRDMVHFVELLQATSGIAEIRTTSDGRIVLDTDEVRAVAPRILERYHIPRDRSSDLPGPLPNLPRDAREDHAKKQAAAS